MEADQLLQAQQLFFDVFQTLINGKLQAENSR